MGGIAGSATYNENLTGTAKTLTNSTIGIVNCYAYPLELASSQDASTTVYHIGGILGRADGAVTVQNCFSPITYSNILRSGTRVNASNFSSLTSIGGIIGRVYAAGATVTRTFSSTAFKRCYGNPGNVSVSHSLNTVKLGDPNMRGWGSTFLGETEYKQVDGGIAAALNAGATEWNDTTPAVEALEWAYDPTFGYPKPVGVDWPGTVTKKVSLIGDSISTYEGFMFAHDKYQQNKHYPNTSDIQDKYKPMVHNEQLTWWWRLIYGKMDNARLEADNAWGGSTVSYVDPIKPGMSTSPSAPHYQENSLQYRYQRYGLGNPDVLFSFGGRNDFGYVGNNSNVLLGDFGDDSLQAAYDAPQELYDNYSQGTVAILKAAHDKNPQLKILLILTDLMNDDFEDAASAVTSFLTDKGFDIRFANLHKRGTTNSTNNDIGVKKEQGSHPNATGCENIANYIWEQYGSWLNE